MAAKGQEPAGKASKTNVSGRKHDPRPKSELVIWNDPVTGKLKRKFVPINRD